MNLLDLFSNQLNFQKEEGLLRTLEETPVDSVSAASSHVDFSSNDYLGYLTQDVSVQSVSGSGSSRLLLQDHNRHTLTEKLISDWQGSATTLVFPSGYQAGLSLSALCSGETVAVFSDEFNHASLIDGLRLRKAKGPTFIYKHLDLDDLNHKLSFHAKSTNVVITETIFSMDGDSPDLNKLVDICLKNDATLIVDESHSVGIQGSGGVGCLDLRVVPESLCVFKVFGFGKALGLQGGAWCGPSLLRDYLVNFSRSHMYSTALTPLVLSVLNERILNTEAREERQRSLQKNMGYFFARMRSLVDLPYQLSPIVPIQLGHEERVDEAQSFFRDKGYLVRGVRFPTVAKGKARLRIILRADHTTEQLTGFTERLTQFLLRKSSEDTWRGFNA